MELDEMKNAWQQLDARLKEQEVLRINIIKEMLYAKSEKMHNRLLRYDWIGLFFMILVSPCVLLMFKFYNTTPLQIVIAYIIAVVYTLCFFYQIWSVYLISKVDTQKPMSENIKYTLKYKISIQWAKFFLPVPLIITLILFFETARITPHFIAKVILYTNAAVLVLFCIACYIWAYKVYFKNIDRLLDSFKEIEELEKEYE